ncbi:MAG: chorismate mutase [Bacteroidota bacterium]|jgi:chorismate mutase
MSSNLGIINFKQWLNLEGPLLICGPCGAESEEQLVETAKKISEIQGVKIFRAGVWKPRTRPNSFEGMGEIALEWLKKVQQETGLKTAIEVANAKHVEKALKHGVDIIWIGARTTVNPFSVQEIADSLRGVDVPILIKNPVHPDLQLWVGAIERILQIGNKKIVAVHRGFHNPKQSEFRNDPFWEIAIELRTIFTDLPVITDPSHIGGRRSKILSISQKAINLGMDGLMIESHINPECALSDKEQQLHPEDLKQLIDKLIFRKVSTDKKELKNTLFHLRKIIDELDEEMILLLKKRSDIIEKIGLFKAEHDITIFQLERWMEILRTRTESATGKGIPKDFIEKICLLLHEESIRKQHEVMNKE